MKQPHLLHRKRSTKEAMYIQFRETEASGCRPVRRKIPNGDEGQSSGKGQANFETLQTFHKDLCARFITSLFQELRGQAISGIRLLRSCQTPFLSLIVLQLVLSRQRNYPATRDHPHHGTARASILPQPIHSRSGIPLSSICLEHPPKFLAKTGMSSPKPAANRGIPSNDAPFRIQKSWRNHSTQPVTLEIQKLAA